MGWRVRTFRTVRTSLSPRRRAVVTEEQVRAALRNVLDPEIHRPIEDIGMLKGI
ncbi:MAG TPA: iron-sulfur cluster assembly protein, partial [Actinomycetota bacterium]|nr:iron-sulfur cluster assembly protein [Actinomycetota bacterium]